MNKCVIGSLSDFTILSFNISFDKTKCAVGFGSNSVSVRVPG